MEILITLPTYTTFVYQCYTIFTNIYNIQCIYLLTLLLAMTWQWTYGLLHKLEKGKLQLCKHKASKYTIHTPGQ